MAQFQIPPNRNMTPLWVITLFLSLTQAIAGIAVTQTTAGVQYFLVIFIVCFPIITAYGFFVVLWDRPHHFYPPSEYDGEVTATEYISAITQRKSLDEGQLYEKIQNIIQATFKSETLIEELEKGTSGNSTENEAKEIKAILGEVADTAVEQIRRENFITIDSTTFLGKEKGKIWRIPYDKFKTVGELGNSIYFTLQGYIAPFTYNKTWVIRDKDSGSIFRDIKTRKIQGRYEFDIRDLKEMGILPGMTLEIIKPD